MYAEFKAGFDMDVFYSATLSNRAAYYGVCAHRSYSSCLFFSREKNRLCLKKHSIVHVQWYLGGCMTYEFFFLILTKSTMMTIYVIYTSTKACNIDEIIKLLNLTFTVVIFLHSECNKASMLMP